MFLLGQPNFPCIGLSKSAITYCNNRNLFIDKKKASQFGSNFSGLNFSGPKLFFFWTGFFRKPMGFLEQDLTIEAAKYPLARLSTRLKAVVRRLSYFFKTATTCTNDLKFLPLTGLLNFCTVTSKGSPTLFSLVHLAENSENIPAEKPISNKKT